MKGKLEIVCEEAASGTKVFCNCSVTCSAREQEVLLDVFCHALDIDIDLLAKAIVRRHRGINLNGEAVVLSKSLVDMITNHGET